MILTTIINTPIGEMMAGATADGLCLLEFIDKERHEKELSYLTHLMNCDCRVGKNIHLKETEKQLREYFKGERKEFNISLITPGSEFQKITWAGLLKIPFGSTRSYRQQAAALDRPGSVRAVARANGMNRIPIIIPCHRVIGSNGQLTGYAGGLIRKKWLIDHEKKISGKEVMNELRFEL